MDNKHFDSETLNTANPMTASSLMVRIIGFTLVWFTIYFLSITMKSYMYVAIGVLTIIKVWQLLDIRFWQRIKQSYEKIGFAFSLLLPISLFALTLIIADVKERQAKVVGEQMVTIINDYHDIHGKYPPSDAIQSIESEKIDYDGRVGYALWQDGTPHVWYSKPMAIFCNYKYDFSTKRWKEWCD